MAARQWRTAGSSAVLALTLATAIAGLGFTERRPAPVDRPTVEAVVGAGILDRVVCLGCAAALFGAGGATVGGMLLEAAFFPEAFGACAYVCVVAFSE